MRGWITALFASSPARKALGLLLAVLTIAFAAYSNRWRMMLQHCGRSKSAITAARWPIGNGAQEMDIVFGGLTLCDAIHRARPAGLSSMRAPQTPHSSPPKRNDQESHIQRFRQLCTGAKIRSLRLSV